MSLWNPEHHQIYTAPPWPTTNISCPRDSVLTEVKTQMSIINFAAFLTLLCSGHAESQVEFQLSVFHKGPGTGRPVCHCV